MRWPRQDIPSIEKTTEWFKNHLTYSESLLKTYNTVTSRMTRLYLSYNGVKTPLSTQWLEKTYGQQNKAKYIAYRLGRTKINLLYGEWLKRPLSATVQTINSDAVSEKMRQVNFMRGAMIAKPELEEIKDKVGVDVMNGVPIPDGEDDPIWAKMSFKDKSEDVMQIILDEQVKELGIKRKVAKMFQDVLITSMCWSKIEINQKGDVEAYRIDPRDAIYEHIEGDDYLEKSPVKGARQVMSVSEILRRFELTKEQRDQLDAARSNPDAWAGPGKLGRGYMSMVNGQLCCDVIHIEWEGLSADYYKTAPKTNSQMMLDPDRGSVEIELDPAKYETNIKAHEKEVANGKYTVETKWRKQMYEATRIGGLIDVNMRVKPFQPRSVDDPSFLLASSYLGFIFGQTDGVRISLQQEIENFDNMFDICMYQILKELSRAKGKVLTYDRAGLPEGQKLSDVMYRVENDQFLDYNSAAAGNFSGRNLDPSSMFKELDLGLSASFPFLLQMKQDIMNNLNQITGINENREGNISASSTATNAQSNIQNSRTITEPMFYGMNEFTQLLLKNIVNFSAISWAFYKLEKGEQILGSAKYKFLQVTQEIGYQNYGVHVEDGSRYAEIKNDMNRLAEFSLNAKEIRPMDVLKMKLAETTSEMKNVLENSWVEMKKVIQDSQERELQSQQQQMQMQQQTQIQLQKDAIEDAQANEKENIVLQGQVQMQIDDNKAKASMVQQQQKSLNDIISNQNGV
jgi:hypothetical protein